MGKEAGGSHEDLTDRLSLLLADLERERRGESRISAWSGDFAIVLRDGSHVITRRTYRERIRRRFSLS